MPRGSDARWPWVELRAAGLLLVVAVSVMPAADIRDAVAALQRGDFAAAERTLRTELAARPGDPAVLSLLGAALDGQQKIEEADPFHRRAVAAAPKSISALGNYGNHLLALGNAEAARKTFEQIAALDAANVQANLQLARMALESNRGPQALEYLKRAPGALETLLEQADPALSFSLGVALGNARQYDQAEVAFTRVLAAEPKDFNALVNLGMAASSAGHLERARGILQSALRRQPHNVEVLFRLADVELARKQVEAAVELLAQAAKLAPQRADIQKLLAVATGDLGALDDSMAAWERYLKIEPNDDFARRERGYTAVRMGKFEQGLADLEGFLAKHPGDPDGHFQLGMALGQSDAVRAMALLDKALALRPDFAAARAARGSLNNQIGKPEAALPDLEIAAKARPDDATNLDRLGQTYVALDRLAEAVRVLRRAAELAPGDSKIQLHFARALAEAGETAESKVVMDRFRQLGPAAKGGVPAGLVDYLARTPEERRADYRARVEKAVKDKPEDAGAQVSWLKLQLEDGKVDEASARRILALKPAAAQLADAGRALLAARQYGLAAEMLEQAHAEPERSIAEFRALDAAGKFEEARVAIERAFRAGPKSAELCWNAAAVLVRNGRAAALLGWLEAEKDDEILLLKAAVLAIAGKADDAKRALGELQAAKPEWGPVWTAGRLLGDPVRLQKLLVEKRPTDW